MNFINSEINNITKKNSTLEFQNNLEKGRTYTFRIEPQSVDFQYKVRLSALTDILLTTAGFNADDNGFGMRLLHSMNYAWVLLRMAIEMDIFPLQYENIHVKTWIEHVGRATTTRHFRIYNDRNEIIGKASSVWAMIDMKTRKAQDLSVLKGIQDFAHGDSINIEKPIKINAIEGVLKDSFKIKYSDIDINGHANSIRYIDWISNCFSLEIYRLKKLKRFEINFMNEMMYDDKVEIYMQQLTTNDFLFEIRKENSVSCRAQINYSET